MAVKKREPQFYGTYWGLKDGKIKSVDEYLKRSGVYLSAMTHDGVLYEHPVLRGRRSSSEVVVVFNLTNVKFVPAIYRGTEHEQKVREELQAIIDSE